MKRRVIDISTEGKKKEVLKKFEMFTTKQEAHKYFGISDNSQGIRYLNEIANEVGFDLSSYKAKKEKEPRYCKECGKEILSRWGKEFCCSSCAATYNNKRRKRRQKIEGRPTASVEEKIVKQEKTHKQENEYICEYCGKTFKSKDKNRRFCSVECNRNNNAKLRAEKTIEKWLSGNLKVKSCSKIPESVRRFLFQKTDYKCEECGFEGYNKITNNTILQIHHVDGDCENNKPENLKVLCPNCHAMTENYMALNKGKSSRTTRYKK